MKQPARFAAVFAATLVPGIAFAQGLRGVPMPAPTPPPMMTITPPPVQPNTLAAMLQTSNQPSPSSSAAMATDANGAPVAPPVDPVVAAAREFQQQRVVGRDLKSSVGRVLGELDWREKLDDARATAAATGKPILWIQALGELDGFA